MSAMRYFVVTASWDPQGCWECDGDNGQAFMFVRAHDGKEALEIATAGLAPREYGHPRFVSAMALAQPVAPNAKNPRRIGEREMSTRTNAYVTVLKAAR